MLYLIAHLSRECAFDHKQSPVTGRLLTMFYPQTNRGPRVTYARILKTLEALLTRLQSHVQTQLQRERNPATDRLS